MREMRREPEVPEERVSVVECLDCRARVTSKELAPLHSVKSGILQNACSTSPRMDADLGEKCSYAHRQVEGLKRMVKKCSGSVENHTTIGLRISRYGAAEVFIDFTEELKLTETNPMCSIH